MLWLCSSLLCILSYTSQNTTNFSLLIRSLVYSPTVGSTHNIAITDDLDEGFKDLAEQRHGAAGIAITEQKPETFNFEEIKQHLDEEGDEPLIQF